eukprot:4225175-Alexandrium_andersonii.AAC.1
MPVRARRRHRISRQRMIRRSRGGPGWRGALGSPAQWAGTHQIWTRSCLTGERARSSPSAECTTRPGGQGSARS